MASFTKFQQRNGTNCEIKNTRNFVVSNSLGKYHLNMYVMKARMPRCVQNYSETHSTGVTGLHSWLRWSHNPVTQSIVFHCHFAHTRAFLLYWHISRPKWVRPNQNCISKHDVHFLPAPKGYATSLPRSMKNPDCSCCINHPTTLASGFSHSELYIIQQSHYFISTAAIL